MKELLYSLIAAFLSLFHQIPDGLEIPAVTNPEAVIEHANYTLQYDERYEQADWVAYELTASEVEGTVKRGNHFREDPYVVTGPVLNKPYYQTIGENKVAVPEFYYKVLLDYKEPEIKGIGFILPNKKCDDGVENYAVTIDKVAEVTGIDFFPKLPDAEEEKIESESELSLWNLFEKK